MMLSPRAKVAAAGGALVLLAFVLMPTGLLEGAVLASGIPAVLSAAEPPLGITARIGLGGLLGGLLAAFLWIGIGLLDEDAGVARSVLARFGGRDAHPDAPRRAPLSASELGEPTPPLISPVPPTERALPDDLDQPLAAYDPAAIPRVPLAPPVAVAPLTPAPVSAPTPRPAPRPALFDPGDRIETFEFTPVQRPAMAEPAPAGRPLSLRVPPANSLRTMTLRDAGRDADAAGEGLPIAAPLRVTAPAPPPMVAPATESSVHALLARLERGLAAAPAPVAAPAPKAAPPPLRSGRLSDTLGDLRKLATAR